MQQKPFFDAPFPDAPISDIDPYEEHHLEDPREFHETLRRNGPLVWLTRYGVWATGKHREVTAIFKNFRTFCSSRGVGLQDFKTEEPWRPPSLILEADPPEHTRMRKVLSSVLSANALSALRAGFEKEAEQRVDRLLGAGEFDGIQELAVGFPITVFPDAVGLNRENRHFLLDYGNLVFNMLGPRNEIAARAAQRAASAVAWIAEQCERENLADGALGGDIYGYVDRGEITETQASLLVRSLLSAGLDTTVIAIGNMLRCFADHPAQWQVLRQDPHRARFAFEEVLRYASPVHTFFRTADEDTEVSGVPIREGAKVLLNIDCANRDTDRWPDANVFDITRRPGGQAAFGVGIHACVGRHLAALESEVLLQTLAAKVRLIELTGAPVPDANNALRGYRELPMRIEAGE
ncbi:MAG: cytochrome P450 [Gammaproteobacteria bacterium]|nr:cytochrome P450 [Gammaproteobacteria bacterium]